MTVSVLCSLCIIVPPCTLLFRLRSVSPGRQRANGRSTRELGARGPWEAATFPVRSSAGGCWLVPIFRRGTVSSPPLTYAGARSGTTANTCMPTCTSTQVPRSAMLRDLGRPQVVCRAWRPVQSSSISRNESIRTTRSGAAVLTMSVNRIAYDAAARPWMPNSGATGGARRQPVRGEGVPLQPLRRAVPRRPPRREAASRRPRAESWSLSGTRMAHSRSTRCRPGQPCVARTGAR